MAPPGKADQFAMWNQDRRAVPLDADAAVLDVIIEGAQTGRFRFGEPWRSTKPASRRAAPGCGLAAPSLM
jgi:hypothetical protein